MGEGVRSSVLPRLTPWLLTSEYTRRAGQISEEINLQADGKEEIGGLAKESLRDLSPDPLPC